ncbi:MAG: SDR family oxidoreductase [Myxococcales bacterium]|nr:SDR family oxidoreductase [Myxococcales bacterium]
MELKDTTMLITGAGRGLGEALARQAAAAGARVVLLSRSERVREIARALRDEGRIAHAIVADVADKDAVFQAAGAAVALVGPIDVLVHNAATLGPSTLRPMLDTDCEDLEHALGVHVLGPFRWSKALLPSMLLRDRGALVHITSDAATTAYPTWGAYGTSKAAMEQLARSFAVELEGTNVRSFSVDPGEMDTDLHARAMPDADRATLASPAAVATRVLAMIAREALAPNGARLIASEVLS